MKLNCKFRIVLSSLFLSGSLMAAPPANDNFANRINLGSAFPTSATGTNLEATEQAGEPLPIDGLSSLWWRWTAAAAGQVEINTAGSLDGTDPLDTVLAVYTGTTLTSLVQVAVNDESNMDSTSLLRFTATAGRTYVIQVLGYNGAQGSVKLNLKPGPPLPANDTFANAVTLTTGVTASGSTDGSTLQPSEAAPVGIYADSYFGSAWWAWTAPGSGWYRLMVVGAGYDQVASVWTGTAVGSLVPVHSNTGGGDQNSVLELYFPALSGTRYPIAVGNAYSVAGVPVSLTITSAEPPVYNASLTVSASSVNVTGASANVNAVLRMISTQPLTGGRLTISNEANYYEEVSFGDGHRTSGNSTDGTYTVPLHFSRYFEPGAYRIINISSEGGGYPQTGELSPVPFAAGTLRTINVINTGEVDYESPTVASVNLTPTAVDVTNEPKTVTVTLQILDDLSGFQSGTLSLAKQGQDGFSYRTEVFLIVASAPQARLTMELIP